jgi:hypothetical protein
VAEESTEYIAVINTNATSVSVRVETGPVLTWGENISAGENVSLPSFTSETFTDSSGSKRIVLFDVTDFSSKRGIVFTLTTTEDYLDVGLPWAGASTEYTGPLYGFNWYYLNQDIVKDYYYYGTPYVESRPKPRIVTITSVLGDAALETFSQAVVDTIGSDPALWILDDGSNDFFALFAMVEQFPNVGFDYFRYSNVSLTIKELL